MKFECCHADTCLPDYWGGHHRPHVQIMAYPGMSLDDIKEALHHEIDQQAIAGSENVEDKPDEWYDAIKASVDELEPKNPSQNTFFDFYDRPKSIVEEPEDEFSDSVYAFFVFMEIDDE